MTFNSPISNTVASALHPPSLPSTDNFSLFDLPAEIIINCLEFLKLKDLMNFSLVGKRAKVLATDPNLLKTVMRNLDMTYFSPTPQEAYRFGQLIYSPKLGLKQYLEKKYPEAIERLNIWNKEITINNDFISLSQIDQFTIDDGKAYLFKTLIQDDLALIHISEDRLSSLIIRFYRNFDPQFLTPLIDNFVYSIYKYGSTSHHTLKPYLNSQEPAHLELVSSIRDSLIRRIMEDLKRELKPFLTKEG